MSLPSVSTATFSFYFLVSPFFFHPFCSHSSFIFLVPSFFVKLFFLIFLIYLRCFNSSYFCPSKALSFPLSSLLLFNYFLHFLCPFILLCLLSFTLFSLPPSFTSDIFYFFIVAKLLKFEASSKKRQPFHMNIFTLYIFTNVHFYTNKIHIFGPWHYNTVLPK